jgi:hypothetical protein
MTEPTPNEHEDQQKSFDYTAIDAHLADVLAARQPLPDANPKTARGKAKPAISSIPPVAILHMGQAMEQGREEYGLMNWRYEPVSASTYYDAMFRHMGAWWDGEDVASDSLVLHLAHVMASCAIVIDALEQGTLIDDRPIKGMTYATISALTKKIGNV